MALPNCVIQYPINTDRSNKGKFNNIKAIFLQLKKQESHDLSLVSTETTIEKLNGFRRFTLIDTVDNLLMIKNNPILQDFLIFRTLLCKLT